MEAVVLPSDTQQCKHATLCQVCAMGHTGMINQVLDTCTEEEKYNLLMLQGSDGWTVTAIAAYYGQTETVQYILNSVESDMRYEMLQKGTVDGLSALHRAAHKGHTEVLKAIVDSVTEEQWSNLLMLQGSNGVTAIAMAALGGHTETVQYILNSVDSDKRYEMLQVRKENGQSALHRAACEGHTEVLKAILDSVTQGQMLSLLMLQANCISVLDTAVSGGLTEVVKAVFDIATKEQWHNLLMLHNSDGFTVLANATLLGHAETVQYILNSVDSDKKYEMLKTHKVNGISTLDLAAYGGHTDVLKTIMNSVTEQELCNLLKEQYKNGPTPLHHAALHGHTDFIDYTHRAVSAFTWYQLLTIEDNIGDNILLEALRGGHTTTAISILESFPPNRVLFVLAGGNHKSSALHVAASTGQSDVVKHILQIARNSRRSNLLAMCNEALMEASVTGHAETVECVLDFVDVKSRFSLMSLKNLAKKTGMHVAASHGYTDTVAVIFKYMSTMQVYQLLALTDSVGNTAVADAASKAHMETIKLMLCLDGLPCLLDILKSRDQTGRTALHHAASCGHLETLVNIVDSLLSDEQKTELLSIEDNIGQRAEQVPICALQDSSDEDEGSEVDEESVDEQIKDNVVEKSQANDRGDVKVVEMDSPYDSITKMEAIAQKAFVLKRRALADKSHVDYSFKDVAKELEEGKTMPTQTRETAIQALYKETDEVYQMTKPRGMALIINNSEFKHALGTTYRKGSDIDATNMARMLRHFDFEVVEKCNLTCEDIRTAIDSIIVKHDEDTIDYGMFVLVLMSHGDENDEIKGADGGFINLKEIYYLLSSKIFVKMAGKPKFVIVQACDGEVKDYGDAGCYFPAESASPPPPKKARVIRKPEVGREIKHLEADDLIIIKPTFSGYASMRDPLRGSPFICYLIHTFYKHACHTDVESLCVKIQQDVRIWSIQMTKDNPQSCCAQTPIFFSTLTGYRKLYLFPGYNGE